LIAFSQASFESVVSYWEVVLKSAKGNLDAGDPRIWRFDALDQLAATAISIRPEHVSNFTRCRRFAMK
jgi:PIN domain nuclease of toxin-antitoxin system